MRLQLFRYKCVHCENWFEAPEVSELAYGEFLLRSQSGETRYLNAIEDSVFTEVDELIGLDKRVASFDKFRRADILSDVFGIACDPDQNGNLFRIGEKAPCSICNHTDIKAWESVEPVKYIDIDVPVVSHEYWNRLTNDEKQRRISVAIDGSTLAGR